MGDKDRNQYRIAFAHLVEMRNQEAQIYWQRAAFAIAIFGVLLAGSGAALGLEVCEGRWWVLLAISLVGIAIGWVWYQWQALGHRWLNWWNAQIAYAEGQAFSDDIRPWRMTVGEWKPDDDPDTPRMVSTNGRPSNTYVEPPYGVAKSLRNLTIVVMVAFGLLAVVMLLTVAGVSTFNSC